MKLTTGVAKVRQSAALPPPELKAQFDEETGSLVLQAAFNTSVDAIVNERKGKNTLKVVKDEKTGAETTTGQDNRNTVVSIETVIGLGKRIPVTLQTAEGLLGLLDEQGNQIYLNCKLWSKQGADDEDETDDDAVE